MPPPTLNSEEPLKSKLANVAIIDEVLAEAVLEQTECQ